MKLRILCVLICLFFLIIVPLTHAYEINVDQIIWQPDPNLNPNSLSATVEFTGVDDDTFLIILTNTSTYVDPDKFDYPATVLLTGIGFNLWGDSEDEYGYIIPNNSITGGLISGPLENASDASGHWGYDNYDLHSGPYQHGEATTLFVNTVISTMEASVDEGPLDMFAGGEGKSFNGPDYGILSSEYSSYGINNMPYFLGYAVITVDLESPVWMSNWAAFFSKIDSNDVVVGFGSPTAPIPEPATMLLLGSGLIGLAFVGRKRFKGGKIVKRIAFSQLLLEAEKPGESFKSC